MKEIFTVAEVATMFGVAEESVRRWIRNGELIAEHDTFSPGKPFMIKASDLEKFEKERRLSHVSEVADD